MRTERRGNFSLFSGKNPTLITHNSAASSPNRMKLFPGDRSYTNLHGANSTLSSLENGERKSDSEKITENAKLDVTPQNQGPQTFRYQTRNPRPRFTRHRSYFLCYKNRVEQCYSTQTIIREEFSHVRLRTSIQLYEALSIQIFSNLPS